MDQFKIPKTTSPAADPPGAVSPLLEAKSRQEAREICLRTVRRVKAMKEEEKKAATREKKVTKKATKHTQEMKQVTSHKKKKRTDWNELAEMSFDEATRTVVQEIDTVLDREDEAIELHVSQEELNDLGLQPEQTTEGQSSEKQDQKLTVRCTKCHRRGHNSKQCGNPSARQLKWVQKVTGLECTVRTPKKTEADAIEQIMKDLSDLIPVPPPLQDLRDLHI